MRKMLLFAVPVLLAACGGGPEYTSTYRTSDGTVIRCDTDVNYNGTQAETTCTEKGGQSSTPPPRPPGISNPNPPPVPMLPPGGYNNSPPTYAPPPGGTSQ